MPACTQSKHRTKLFALLLAVWHCSQHARGHVALPRVGGRHTLRRCPSDAGLEGSGQWSAARFTGEKHWRQAAGLRLVGRALQQDSRRRHFCRATIGFDPEGAQTAVEMGFAMVTKANSMAKLFDYVVEWQGFFRNGGVELIDERGNRTRQAEKLRDDIVARVKAGDVIAVSTTSDRIPHKPLEGTGFMKLMTEVLAAPIDGCTAVHAEPGIGKSIAALQALPAGNASKNFTVLLDGDFGDELAIFCSTTTANIARQVLRDLFRILHKANIHLNMIIDNAFESDVEGNNLIPLAKCAFDNGHQIVVIVQKEDIAQEIGVLNGATTQVASQQQPASTYRWQEQQAREYFCYLLESSGAQSDEINLDKLLENSRIPDDYGGWTPRFIQAYLKFGKMPTALAPGSATTQAIAWAQQLQQDGVNLVLVGEAFPIDPVPRIIGLLKKEIKKENPNRIQCDAVEISIYSAGSDGKWQRETKMSKPLSTTTEERPYGFLLP